MIRRVAVGMLLALTVASLAGCSQVAAVAPVGGARLAEVRFAANDVLVAAGVESLTAPVCADDEGVVTCEGSALDGRAITVDSPTPDELVVRVGDDELYDGTVAAVIADAVEGAP